MIESFYYPLFFYYDCSVMILKQVKNIIKNHFTPLAVVFLSVILNYQFFKLCFHFKLPLFGDSWFTIVTAAFWGPWWGMVTGFFTNLLMDGMAGFSGAFLPFAVVNMATGFFIGTYSRRGCFSSLGRFVLCFVGITFINALLGTLIIVLRNPPVPIQAFDSLKVFFKTFDFNDIFTAFLVRIPLNLIDKGLALIVVLPLSRRLKGLKNDRLKTNLDFLKDD